MSEINCEIVRDLLPLYADDAVSEKSAEAVREHISGCAECMEIYDKLKTEIRLPVKNDESLLKRARKKFLKKKIIISFVSVVSALAVIISAALFCTFHEIPVEYDEIKDHIVVEKNEYGSDILYIDGIGDFFCNHITSVSSMMNEEKKCHDEYMIIYFTKNIWQKYFGFGKNRHKKYLITTLYDVEDGKSLEPDIWEYEGDDESNIVICRTTRVYYATEVKKDGRGGFIADTDNPGELIWEREE